MQFAFHFQSNQAMRFYQENKKHFFHLLFCSYSVMLLLPALTVLITTVWVCSLQLVIILTKESALDILLHSPRKGSRVKVSLKHHLLELVITRSPSLLASKSFFSRA